MAKNVSGEKMQNGTSDAARNTMRKIRRYCEKRGALIIRFRQVYGFESNLGCQWIANVSRWPDAMVVVYRVSESENDKFHLTYPDKYGWFGVNFLGSSEFVKTMQS